ncbi:MAG: DNA polymerase III subunit beta [Deltaproteobacteria bacterium]|nr:DNA polymerase III subunit beta [Deltaproteobacteria bacterium]
MKLAVKKEVLASALYRVQGVAERKSTTPALSHVLVEALKEGVVRISATDLEIAITGDYAAKVDEPGKVLVSARSLFEITRSVTGEDVQLRSREGGELEVKAGRSEWKLICLPAADFPGLPQLGGVETFSITVGELSRLCQRTVYAALQDDSRPNLNGVMFEGVQGRLRIVAADGHRLAKADGTIKKAPKGALKEKVIVPRKAMNELRRLLDGEKGECEIGFSDRAGLVRCGNVVLMLRLIEGKYPDYNQVIPAASEWKVVAERAPLVGALKRVSILSSESATTTRVELEKGAIRFVVSNPDAGEAKEEIPAEYTGRKLQIGFNARYLIDALASFECDAVQLEFNDELSPCLMRPHGEKVDDDTAAIVMPMRI